MNELKIFNEDLLPVYTTDTGEKVVIARELHERLGIGKKYADWFKQMCEYGFEQGSDYDVLLPQKGKQDKWGGSNRIDHIIKFDMAKHICMIQRTPIGKEIRQKLIDLEREVAKAPDSYMIDDPIERARAWIKEHEAMKALETKIKEMRPKEIFTDAVSASSTSILIGDLAKLIKQNGQNIGQKRLFQWLRDNGYLIKRKGADYNSPTQKAMDLGLFEIKETTIVHSDGHVSINKTPKVTGKGQVYFINKFLDSKENRAD